MFTINHVKAALPFGLIMLCIAFIIGGCGSSPLTIEHYPSAQNAVTINMSNANDSQLSDIGKYALRTLGKQDWLNISDVHNDISTIKSVRYAGMLADARLYYSAHGNAEQKMYVFYKVYGTTGQESNMVFTPNPTTAYLNTVIYIKRWLTYSNFDDLRVDVSTDFDVKKSIHHLQKC